jgi:hypothetical protein
MKHQEAELQKACVRWHSLQYPKDYYLLYMNHQNGKSAAEQGRLKSMGLVPGVADLTMLSLGRVDFFELKVGKNKQTEKQKEFQQAVEDCGYHYHLVYSLDKFIEIVNKIKDGKY